MDIPEEEFLDLDIKSNLNEFRKYCEEQRRQLEAEGISLELNSNDERIAIQKFKCFFMDLFKKEKGYQVVSKTFAKKIPYMPKK